MKQSLDASHQTLLDNFHTFLRAQRCLEEVKTYVRETLKEVEGELPVMKTPPSRFKYNKDGWLQADAFLGGLENEKSTHHLVSIGIDNLDVSHIIATGECRAYIYCGLLADSNKTEWHGLVGKFLGQLKPPNGFTPAPTDSEGYVFVKRLGKLPVSGFCSSAELKKYLREPLVTLVGWLTANALSIATFGKTAMPEMPPDAEVASSPK